jgi:dipeptidyl aminopeptidase/acylaminoacyl peptidase
MHSNGVVFRYRGAKLLGVLNRLDSPNGHRFPGVLFLHGFPGAEKSVDIQRRLLRKGVVSFAPHFRGTWGSEGEFRFTDLVDQARAALRFLRGQAFVDPARLAVFGFSMGGWTAINLSAREPALKAVAAAAPAGGPEMVIPEARSRLARMRASVRSPALSELYRDFVRAVNEFDPARSAARRTCPLLIIHGTEDTTVPTLVSRRIFAAASGPKKYVLARGARHDFLDRREWLSRLVADWLIGRLRD